MTKLETALRLLVKETQSHAKKAAINSHDCTDEYQESFWIGKEAAYSITGNELESLIKDFFGKEG